MITLMRGGGPEITFINWSRAEVAEVLARGAERRRREERRERRDQRKEGGYKNVVRVYHAEQVCFSSSLHLLFHLILRPAKSEEKKSAVLSQRLCLI